MSKKIGIDTRCLCEENWSGVGVYTYNLLDNLFQIDKENEYFLFCNSFNKGTDYKELLKRWDYPNVHFCNFSYPNKILNFGLKFFNYPKIDKLIGKNLDYFLIPNLNFVSLSKNIKKILVVHDLSFEIYPNFFSPKSRLWHNLINPKKLIKNVDAIVAVSRNTAYDVSNIYNIDFEKIKIIHSGVKESNVLETKLKEVREKYNLPEKFILYLGNVEPRKNIISLIEGFEKFKNNNEKHHLVIIGNFGYKSKSIFEKIEENKFGNSIRIINYVPNEDKHAFYKLSNIFIFPSFYEGFGFPPLEAMSQGVPIISSISSSLAEVIGNAGLLVDPHNINELYYSINEIISNDKLRNDLIQKGYEKIKMFKWQKTAEEFKKILK